LCEPLFRYQKQYATTVVEDKQSSGFYLPQLNFTIESGLSWGLLDLDGSSPFVWETIYPDTTRVENQESFSCATLL